MKIVLITHLYPNPFNTAFGSFNMARAKQLKNSGHDVKVICPIGMTPPEGDLFPVPRLIKLFKQFRTNRGIRKTAVIEGIETFYPQWFWLPKRRFWRYEHVLLHWCAGRFIRRVIDDYQPDLVLSSWMHPYGTYIRYLEKYYSGNTMSIAEGGDVLVMPFQYPGWSKVENSINHSSQILLFVSRVMQQEVESKLGLKQGYVLYNGFDQDAFYFTDRKDTRSKERFRIVSVGNLTRIKGHDLLLQAMTILDARFTLTIIGDGEERAGYEKFIEENNLNGRVSLMGRVSNNHLRTLLEQADFFCMPSRSESFGIAALEAMACGLPVIGADTGGLKELVITDFNGCRFEAGNRLALAAKLNYSIGRDWNRMAIAKWAKDNYSLTNWADRLMELVKSTSNS